MKIELHTKDELIEIEKISYLIYSKKETMVYYDYYYEKKSILLDGWLSPEQICDRLLDLLKKESDK